MGNIVEKWMYDKLKIITPEKYSFKNAPLIKDVKRNKYLIKLTYLNLIKTEQYYQPKLFMV